VFIRVKRKGNKKLGWSFNKASNKEEVIVSFLKCLCNIVFVQAMKFDG
jgi:hypothetical protein